MTLEIPLYYYYIIIIFLSVQVNEAFSPYHVIQELQWVMWTLKASSNLWLILA